MNTRRPIDTRWSALALIAGVTLLRILYLLRFCPYDLIEDEAHYWLWSKRLAFSYYSKGPGIAWLIAGSTRLFGDTEFAVRVPAAFSVAVAAWATSVMAWRISRDRRVEFATAALFLLAPMLQGVALVGTIDAPLLACWALAALLCQRALSDDRVSSWLLLGVVVAIGTLFKHTMLLTVPAIALAVLLSKKRVGARALVAPLAFFALVAPMFVADRSTGWPALHHLIGHLRLAGGDMPVAPWHYDPLWTLAFLALPLAIVGPALIVGGMEMMRTDSRNDDETVLKLFCAVPLAFYFVVSLLAKPQGNWLIPAFVTLLPFAGKAAVQSVNPHFRRIVIAAVVIGLITGAGMLRLDLIARIPGAGALVPIERIFGTRTIAASVDETAARLRRAGDDPIIIASHYGIASQLAFYLPHHPNVYCASRYVGGRTTQFDLWPETDLARAGHLRGRTAVLISPNETDWSRRFDRFDPTPINPAHGRYEIAVGHGFEPPSSAAGISRLGLTPPLRGDRDPGVR